MRGRPNTRQRISVELHSPDARPAAANLRGPSDSNDGDFSSDPLAGGAPRACEQPSAFVDAYSALNWESLGMLEDGTINLDAESQVVNNGEQEARDSAQKLDSRRERRRYSFARLSAGVGVGHRREDVYR
jgi:hypothetical protein